MVDCRSCVTDAASILRHAPRASAAAATSIAAKFSTTWLARLAPVITVDTCGLAAHHAIDSWASEQPSSSAIGRSRSTLASVVGVGEPLGQPPVAGQRATASRRGCRRWYLPVSSPLASGLQIVVPRPMSSYSRAYSFSTLLAVEQVVLRLLHHRLVQVVALGDLPRGADLVGRPLAGAPVQRLARRR